MGNPIPANEPLDRMTSSRLTYWFPIRVFTVLSGGSQRFDLYESH